MQCPGIMSNFCSSFSWVHVENNPLVGRCIFVHAGLESDGSEDCEDKLDQLLRKDASSPMMTPLFGRESVLDVPTQLAQNETTVISGHHGQVLFNRHRIVLDSCSGSEGKPLKGLILPEGFLVSDDGAVDESHGATISLLVFGKGCRPVMNSDPQNGTGAHRHSENYAPVLSLPKGDTPVMPFGRNPLERTAEDDSHFDITSDSSDSDSSSCTEPFEEKHTCHIGKQEQNEDSPRSILISPRGLKGSHVRRSPRISSSAASARGAGESISPRGNKASSRRRSSPSMIQRDNKRSPRRRSAPEILRGGRGAPEILHGGLAERISPTGDKKISVRSSPRTMPSSPRSPYEKREGRKNRLRS